jgi:hypothetical protein
VLENLENIEKGDALTGKRRLYKDVLALRLERVGEERENDFPDESRENDVVDLAKRYANLFLQSARRHDGEPAARLSVALDRLIGERATNALRKKGIILGAVWRMLERCWCHEGTWTIRTRLANHYVGESEAGSLEEDVGLRLNRGLVADEAFLEHGGRLRLSAIWSQSGAVLASRGASLRQVASTFIVAGKVYRQTGEWRARLNRAWSRAGGEGEPVEADLAEALSKEQWSALEALRAKPTDASAADAVAGEALGESVTPLAKAEAFVDNAWLEGQTLFSNKEDVEDLTKEMVARVRFEEIDMDSEED